jgi:hypothetical protein
MGPASAASPHKGNGLHPTGFVRTPGVSQGITKKGQQLMALTPTYPTSVDMTQWNPPVGDQGQVGSCTSWATGYYSRYWLRNHALGDTTTYAPMFLYAQISKGVDAGSSFPSNFQIMDAQGITPMSSYSHGNYDYTDQPTSADIAAAAPYKETTYSMIFSGSSSSNQDAVMAAMANGNPVMVAIPVYPEFDYVSSANGWLVNPPTAGEVSRGGHALFSSKYDANGIWIENSWGTGWGNAGWAELSWAFIDQYAYEGWTASSSTVDVASGTTVVSSFSPISGPVGTSVTISGLAFTGATAVSFNGTPATFSVTNDNTISATVPAGATSGVISVTGAQSTGTGTSSFTVTLPTTTLTYNGTTSAVPGAPITLSATLKNASAAPIVGATVNFTLNGGGGYSGVTNASGVATANATAPSTIGSYPIGASFAGDGVNAASSTSATLKVAKATSTVKYTGSTSALRNGTLAVSATVKSSTGAAIQGAVVTFSFGGKTVQATTGANGVASTTIVAPSSKGNVKMTVSWPGNSDYAGASTTATIRVS